ncbi:hypothetical protein ACWCRF_37850 [Streptomyces sp. NPDC002405]|uniref:hypothetical protein n=1 Tax=Streptomyces sp. NPDC001231 TaxID=3364549 RepID=UPI0036A81D16
MAVWAGSQGERQGYLPRILQLVASPEAEQVRSAKPGEALGSGGLLQMGGLVSRV